jgi:hypothetical protein
MIDRQHLQDLAEFAKPATSEEIYSTQAILEKLFPSEYIQLLECSNGISLKTGRLYSTDDLVERNSTYEVAIYAPSFVLIGDDGGGYGIYIESSPLESSQVYLIYLGSGVIEDAHILANSLNDWLHKGFALKHSTPSPYPTYVDVYLIKPPANGPKDLLLIKGLLNLQTSIGSLYRSLANTPYRLLRSVPFGKYAKICAEYNQKDNCLGLYEVDKTDSPLEIPESV